MKYLIFGILLAFNACGIGGHDPCDDETGYYFENQSDTDPVMWRAYKDGVEFDNAAVNYSPDLFICSCGNVCNSSPQIHFDNGTGPMIADSICLQKDNVWVCFVSPYTDMAQYELEKEGSYYNPDNWVPIGSRSWDYYLTYALFTEWGEER